MQWGGRGGFGRVLTPFERCERLVVGQHDISVPVHDDDALMRAFHGVEQAALGRLALRHLALHHAAQVLAHGRERVEQDAELILAALGHRAVELPLGDPAGNVRSDGDLADDMAGQQPGDRGGEQHRGRQAGDVQPPILGHRRPGALPIAEAVPGGVVYQQVDLTVGGPDIAFDGVLGCGGRVALLPGCVPGGDGGLGPYSRLSGPRGLRTFGGDFEILVERVPEPDESRFQLGPHALIRGLGVAPGGDLHQGEVCGGCAGRS